MERSVWTQHLRPRARVTAPEKPALTRFRPTDKEPRRCRCGSDRSLFQGHTPISNLIDLARHISTPNAGLTVAYSPIILPMQGCQPLELRMTAPAEGTNVPIVLFSYGYGPFN